MKLLSTFLVMILSWLVAGPVQASSTASALKPTADASVGVLFSGQPAGRVVARMASPVSVGNLLATRKAMTVTGIRYWSASSSDTAGRSALLSTSAGKILSRVVMPTTTVPTNGWVNGTFASPVNLTSGQSVIASVSSPNRYVVRTQTFPPSTYVQPSRGMYSTGVDVVPRTAKTGYLYVVDLLVQPPAVVSAPTPTSTPTPTPTVSSLSGFPTSSDVGWQVTGATLTPYSGPNEITVDGTVIDGADITVPLIVSANNVTIRNSRITSATAWYVVRQYPEFSHLTLQNVELVNQVGEHPDWAIFAGPYLTVANSLIHGMQRGIYASNNMTVRNSYLDDFDNPSTSHAQAILSSGNIHNVTLTNNTFGCGTGMCTAALSIFPETWTGGPNDHWLIDHNQLNGGSYALYAGYSPSSGESPNTYMTFTNNVFGSKYFALSGEFGYVASWCDVATNLWSGNTTADGTVVTS